MISWGAVNGPAPQTPVASAGVNPAFAQLRGFRTETLGELAVAGFVEGLLFSSTNASPDAPKPHFGFSGDGFVTIEVPIPT